MKRKNGFTLIELLVVVAILSLLAAILFPVFSRARENARRVSCQSNHKQIGLALMQYVQDNDEKFPPFIPNVVRNHALFVIRPYLKSYQIYHCPSDSTEISDPNALKFFLPGEGWVAVCSYNMTRDAGTADAPAPGAYWGLIDAVGVSLADVPNPAETIMITEHKGVSDPDNGAYHDNYTRRVSATTNNFTGPNEDPSNLVTVRHLEGANYSFADGHVKWFPRKDAPYNENGEATGANATINGVRYYYFWRKGVVGK